MGLIGNGKQDLAKAIEQELDSLAHGVAELRTRASESADDAQGLNGLAQALKSFGLALEQEVDKLRDAKDATLKKLGLGKDPIVSRVNTDHLKAVTETASARGIEA